jgi:2-hydroxychromene-2-carboxylate isomerase
VGEPIVIEPLEPPAVPQVTFFYDLGSPFAYLTAERLSSVLPEPVAWQPVSLGGLFKLTGRSSWALGDRRRRKAGMAEIEARARRRELPPMRWPDPWPGHYLAAMRAATYADRVGRGREFAICAFRRAFVVGDDLGTLTHVLGAATDAGLDREDVERAIQEPEIKQRLRDATDRARQLGVYGVPTIAVGSEVFWGDDRLEEAASHLERISAR